MIKRLFLAALLALPSAVATAQLQYRMPPEDQAAHVARMLMEGGRFRIYASGQIETGDAGRLRQFVRANNIDWAVIAFDSPGGSLAEALLLGNAIRDLGFDTEVGRFSSDGQSAQAVCASSCAYAFAGGVNRYFSAYSGRLGVHQFYLRGQAQANVSDVQVASAILVEFLNRMGVDASAFSAAATASSDQMLWLTPADAESLRLANNGNQATIAEIRTENMVPYLRLEQVRQSHHSRVLVLCGADGPVLMAGIVSQPEDAAMQAAMSVRSYLELDGEEALIEQGNNAMLQQGSVLWLTRRLNVPTISRLLRTNQLDFWGEGGGAVRWGGMMDLRPVRQQLAAFVNDCLASRR